jgi:hypothetical protein
MMVGTLYFYFHQRDFCLAISATAFKNFKRCAVSDGAKHFIVCAVGNGTKNFQGLLPTRQHLKIS